MSPLIQRLMGALLVACAAVAHAPAIAGTLPISQVIEAIKSEIAIARLASDREDARFKISSVDIDLTAVAKTEADGGVRIEIPSSGTSAAREVQAANSNEQIHRGSA